MSEDDERLPPWLAQEVEKADLQRAILQKQAALEARLIALERKLEALEALRRPGRAR